MKFFKLPLFVVLISSLLFAGNEVFLNPNNDVVDFTFETVENQTDEFETLVEVDKINWEVDAIKGLIPRTFVLKNCIDDPYDNTYCPEALSPAEEYWGYNDAEVITNTSTVTDYEQGTYQELTSTVRDWMDGFANEHSTSVTDYQTGSGEQNVGTVIDYMNGSSIKRTNSVLDYTKKITTTEQFCSINTGVRMYSNCAPPQSYYFGVSYCDDLVEGGYSDWRIPVLSEIATSAGMGANGVPSCSGYTWTATKAGAINRLYSWHGGETTSVTMYNNSQYVRCVR